MRTKSQPPGLITKGPMLKGKDAKKKTQTKIETKKAATEELLEKPKLRPKSEIPGFRFTLNIPKIQDLQVSEKILQIINEHSLYPKSTYSDTDCPPSPPYNPLFDEKENFSDFNTPRVQEKSDFGTQTEKKSRVFKSEGPLRRSERLAKKRLTKEKLQYKSHTVKKIKYN